MNISSAIALCLQSAHAARAVNTARAYANGLTIFLRMLVDQEGLRPESEAATITMEHFIHFPGFLLQQGYTRRTAGVYVSAAKYLMHWLIVDAGHLEPTYAQSLRFTLAVEQIGKHLGERMPRHPALDDVDKMRAAMALLPYPTPALERNHAILEVLIATGARNAEICGLKVGSLGADLRSAVVLGKGNKERRVFLGETAIAALRTYWTARGDVTPDQPVFIRHDRGAGTDCLPLTTTTVRTIVHQAAMLAGLEFTPHYFRHAFAIRVLRETGNLALVQDMLGHKSPAATRVYAKIYPEELQKAHGDIFA